MKIQDDYLNKGVPIDPSIHILVDFNALYYYATDKEEVKKQLKKYDDEVNKYIASLLSNKSTRFLYLIKNFIVKYDKNTKTNQLTFNPEDILHSLMYYLNIDFRDVYDPKKREDVFDRFNKELKRLYNITSKGELEKKFPKLYKFYLAERKVHDNYLILKQRGYSDDQIINTMLKDYKNINGESNEELIESIKNMNSAKEFGTMYSYIISEVFSKIVDIMDYSNSHPIDILNTNQFDKEGLEAYIAKLHIDVINKVIPSEVKQKFLYYLTAYFNEHKNWLSNDKRFMIYNGNNSYEMSFKELYNKYIDILVDNPELKIVNYTRDDFDGFTPEEVEEYMNLELQDAQANWSFLEKDKEEERMAKAIHNRIDGIIDPVKRKKTIAELRSLYMRKKELFDGEFDYKTVEGKNAFDGYLAFIYPNGKVILERFFKRRKDGSEVIATDQAIYVMNIEEFYNYSRLSKTEIIRDKLCKRYIHKGAWQERVREEINKLGNTPDTEYKHLVYSKKINDNNINKKNN